MRIRARARRRKRITYALAVAATSAVAAVAVGEVARVWRRGSAPLPAETDDVLGAAEEAARETMEVAVEGYRTTPPRENALFNLLVSFVLTFGIARVSAHMIRRRGRFGPFRDLLVGRRHIHHFVPGIVLAFVSGGAALVVSDEERLKRLAIPFGTGVALTLDESALLLGLEDVYWTEDGIVSVQITLATTAVLAALVLTLRLLRRGEQRVLAEVSEPSTNGSPVAAGAASVN